MKIKERELLVNTEQLTIIEQMEKDWPEMTKEFKKIQREQYTLFLHKQHDYGPGNISVGTQLQTSEEVKLSLTDQQIQLSLLVLVHHSRFLIFDIVYNF